MTNTTNTVNNTTVNTKSTLTAKEIFDQIVALQYELGSLSHLTEAVQTIYNKDENENSSENASEDNNTDEYKTKSVEYLTDAFNNREETYWKMLRLYEKMYDDIATTKTSNATKQAIFHVMDCGEDEMDDHAKLSAIAAVLQSEDAV